LRFCIPSTSFLAEDANTLSDYLFTKGIQSRRFFYPLHLQPCYKGILAEHGNFTLSELIYKQGISLPSSYLLKDEEQTLVITAIREFYS
jgi:perosamine synthetase